MIIDYEYIGYTYRAMANSDTLHNTVPLDQIMSSTFFPSDEWEVLNDEEKMETIRAWHEQHYNEYIWIVQFEEHLD